MTDWLNVFLPVRRHHAQQLLHLLTLHPHLSLRLYQTETKKDKAKERDIEKTQAGSFHLSMVGIEI
jgi:hypothetical protein